MKVRKPKRSQQILEYLDQLEKVQTFRYFEAGFLSLPTPRDTVREIVLYALELDAPTATSRGLGAYPVRPAAGFFPSEGKVTRSNRVGCPNFLRLYRVVSRSRSICNPSAFVCVSNLIKVVVNRRWRSSLLKCESPIRGLALLQVRAAAFPQELPVLATAFTRVRVSLGRSLAIQVAWR